MKTTTLRAVYFRSLFLLTWLALTIVVAHAIVGAASAQTAYPRSLQASTR
jgi:hypothetical protein